MILNNKLKLALFSLLASQSIAAITIEPVDIQSSAGELLYAELKFRNVAPGQRLEVRLANPDELSSIGASHQPPGHLNFYTRRNSHGEGVITITSSRPMTQTELNIVVKVQVGDSARLQHIRKPLIRSSNLTAHNQQTLAANETALKPIMIVSEKEIALNLAESTQYTPIIQPAKPTENLLNVRHALPPALNVEAPVAVSTAVVEPSPSINTAMPANVATPAQAAPEIASTPQVVAPKEPEPQVTAQVESTPVSENLKDFATTETVTTLSPQTATSDEPLVEKPAAEQQKTVQPEPEPITVKNESVPPVKPIAPTPIATVTPVQQHVVRSNESLWKIANRLAKEQNRPIQEVMQQIKQQNEHAFIQGDVNRLRRGVTLSLDANAAPKQPEQQKRQIAELAKAMPSTQSGKAKYRLNQAEMSLVAQNEQDSNRASATDNTKTKKTSKELSLKVMTAREKTVKLQTNVTQLELALLQKDHRIQLLNARLAQLQQQLQAQNADKKPKL